MAEAAASDPLPRHDGAGAAYGLYCSHRGGRRRLAIQPDRRRQVQQLAVSLVDTQEEILAGVLQRVDADRRHHRARGSRGKTLPHFTVGDYVLVARVSRQGKHRKLMST